MWRSGGEEEGGEGKGRRGGREGEMKEEGRKEGVGEVWREGEVRERERRCLLYLQAKTNVGANDSSQNRKVT